LIEVNLVFTQEFSPIKQVLTVPTNLERRVSPTEDKMNIENQVESESEPVPSLPTSIDQCIYIPQIDAVIIVDLQNGLFLARLEGENTATLKPYFQLDVRPISHLELRQDKVKMCVSLYGLSKKPNFMHV
jgi:bifunctional DNase/RNase